MGRYKYLHSTDGQQSSLRLLCVFLWRQKFLPNTQATLSQTLPFASIPKVNADSCLTIDSNATEEACILNKIQYFDGLQLTWPNIVRVCLLKYRYWQAIARMTDAHRQYLEFRMNEGAKLHKREFRPILDMCYSVPVDSSPEGDLRSCLPQYRSNCLGPEGQVYAYALANRLYWPWEPEQYSSQTLQSSWVKFWFGQRVQAGDGT